MAQNNIPPLPPPTHGAAWPADIRTAYETIREAFDRAFLLLQQDDTDPLRLRYHLARLNSNTIPIILALEEGRQTSHIPLGWLESVAECIGGIIARLEASIEGTELRCGDYLL